MIIVHLQLELSDLDVIHDNSTQWQHCVTYIPTAHSSTARVQCSRLNALRGSDPGSEEKSTHVKLITVMDDSYASRFP